MLNLILLLCKKPAGLCQSDIESMSALDFAVKNTYGESKDFESRLFKFIDSFTKSDSAFH